MRECSKRATLSKRRTELAKVFNIRMQDVLIVLFAVLDWKEDRIELADRPYVLGSQRRECHTWYWHRRL